REYKETEGNPEIKQQRKQLARELANSAPQKRVGNSNVGVTNPTQIGRAWGLPISREQGNRRQPRDQAAAQAARERAGQLGAAEARGQFQRGGDQPHADRKSVGSSHLARTRKPKATPRSSSSASSSRASWPTRRRRSAWAIPTWW